MPNDPRSIVNINNEQACFVFLYFFKNLTRRNPLKMAAEILQMSSLLANMRCSSMVVMGNPQCYYGNVQQGRRRVLCCKNGFVFSPQYCRCMPANFGKSWVQFVITYLHFSRKFNFDKFRGKEGEGDKLITDCTYR